MFVHGKLVHDAALQLIAAGVNDCEIARRLGIPRTTVRDWRHPRYVPRAKSPDCPRCWRSSRPVVFDAKDYAELLGLYLGDGHITVMERTQRLRLFLDARYTRIVDEAEALLRRVFPGSRVGRLLRHDGAMVVLYLYHSHLACLFPQHGPGKKHNREIVLERWQEDLVLAAPWSFIKGCIRSDGCVFINRTGKYEYLSYCFDNRSREIRELFTAVCRFAGLEPRPAGTSVRIYQRASVALLVEHVGVKE
jgi:Homeodomain-like domain